MHFESYPMAFRLTTEERVRAASGVPAFIRRRRRIEDLQQALDLELSQLLKEARLEAGDDELLAQQLFETRARELDLRLLNDLIDRHNRFYPIEANLPIDVRTGRLMSGGKPWKPLERVQHQHLIDQVRAPRSDRTD